MTTPHAYIAANRFGLGPWPGQLRQIAGDPRGWLVDQLRASATEYKELRDMPSTSEAVKSTKGALLGLKKLQVNLGRKSKDGQTKDNVGAIDLRKELKQATDGVRQNLEREIFLRTRIAVQTENPLLERLVHFWSNHFTVSTTRKETIGLVGAFEREVVRPHILGNFTDMVLASSRHPAMLLYLDNVRSIGPNSRAGQRRGKGLNENLAREILELHTLGVDGGYTQEDVEQFARMLTGWTIEAEIPKRVAKHFRNGMPPGTVLENGFQFQPLLHEPGTKTLLGKAYREDGYNEAAQAIRDLCAHPSTARFVATKLARHFIADDPPRSAVEKLARAFRDSDGDLEHVTRTLISLPQVWHDTMPKVKTPNELVISTLRAIGLNMSPAELSAVLKEFNQMPFSAPSPAGWPDEAKFWIGPEAMVRRVEWAQLVASRASRRIDVTKLMDDILGPVLSPGTRLEISRAPDAVTGLILLLTSPEFQRR